MNPWLVLAFILVLAGAGYWFYSTQFAPPVLTPEALLAREGLDSQAFFSNELIGLAANQPGVSSDKLQRVKTGLEQLQQKTMRAFEKEELANLIALTDFYQKKQALKEQSAFFQQATGNAACAELAKADVIEEQQLELYLVAVDLEVRATEFQLKNGKQIFEMHPELEHGTLESLRAEKNALSFGCLSS